MFDNWNVVEVLIALVGLFLCVAKPLIENAKTTEKLITSMENLSKDLKELKDNNSETHRRIFKRVEETEGIVENHEMRIRIIETNEKIENMNNK